MVAPGDSDRQGAGANGHGDVKCSIADHNRRVGNRPGLRHRVAQNLGIGLAGAVIGGLQRSEMAAQPVLFQCRDKAAARLPRRHAELNFLFGKRVQNLEAIVTGDSYELKQEAQAAGLSRIDPSLLDGDLLTGEKAAEQLARRIRER